MTSPNDPSMIISVEPLARYFDSLTPPEEWPVTRWMGGVLVERVARVIDAHEGQGLRAVGYVLLTHALIQDCCEGIDRYSGREWSEPYMAARVAASGKGYLGESIRAAQEAYPPDFIGTALHSKYLQDLTGLEPFIDSTHGI